MKWRDAGGGITIANAAHGMAGEPGALPREYIEQELIAAACRGQFDGSMKIRSPHGGLANEDTMEPVTGKDLIAAAWQVIGSYNWTKNPDELARRVVDPSITNIKCYGFKCECIDRLEIETPALTAWHESGRKLKEVERAVKEYASPQYDALVAEFQEYVNSHADHRPPTRNQTRAELKKRYPGLKQEVIDELRNVLAPPHWHRSGPRGPKNNSAKK